jgi:hypothetical protein
MVQKQNIRGPENLSLIPDPDPVKKAQDTGSGSATMAFLIFLGVLMKTTSDVHFKVRTKKGEEQYVWYICNGHSNNLTQKT